MKKAYVAILSIIFVIGFILGRFTSSKPEKSITVENKAIHEESKSQVQVVAEVKKDSTTVKQMTRKEVHYSKAGHVSKIIETTESFGQQVVDNSLSETTADTFTTQDTKQSSVSILTYQKNWLLGAYVPFVKDYNDIKLDKVTLSLSYRIFDTLYVSTSTNPYLSSISIGIQKSF